MKEPLLFTPGPLTTSMKTKKSMLVDYGSWDDEFNSITAKIRKKVIKIVQLAKIEACAVLFFVDSKEMRLSSKYIILIIFK